MHRRRRPSPLLLHDDHSRHARRILPPADRAGLRATARPENLTRCTGDVVCSADGAGAHANLSVACARTGRVAARRGLGSCPAAGRPRDARASANPASASASCQLRNPLGTLAWCLRSRCPPVGLLRVSVMPGTSAPDLPSERLGGELLPARISPAPARRVSQGHGLHPRALAPPPELLETPTLYSLHLNRDHLQCLLTPLGALLRSGLTFEPGTSRGHADGRHARTRPPPA